MTYNCIDTIRRIDLSHAKSECISILCMANEKMNM